MTQEEIAFFDKIAPKWDSMEKLSVASRINPILDMAEVCKGDNVLDLGTGTGVLIPYLSQRVGSRGHILGIDISTGMLDRAIRKWAAIDNVEFLNLDFEKIQPEGTYDRIFLYCVYPHLHHPEATISNLCARNLKQNGKIVIAFPVGPGFINNIHHDRKIESDLLPSARELASSLCEQGFNAKCLSDTDRAYVVTVEH